MEDNLIFLKTEDNLNCLKMEDDLKYLTSIVSKNKLQLMLRLSWAVTILLSQLFHWFQSVQSL